MWMLKGEIAGTTVIYISGTKVNQNNSPELSKTLQPETEKPFYKQKYTISSTHQKRKRRD